MNRPRNVDKMILFEPAVFEFLPLHVLFNITVMETV